VSCTHVFGQGSLQENHGGKMRMSTAIGK